MEVDTCIPMLPLGEVMASGAAGEVVESKHPDFAEGDLVAGIFGWQDYAVSTEGFGGGLVTPQKIPLGVDIPTALSLFGITGLTAYFGLLDLGQPNAGDHGARLRRGRSRRLGRLPNRQLKGCRVVDIAGGQRKCHWLRARS